MVFPPSFFTDLFSLKWDLIVLGDCCLIERVSSHLYFCRKVAKGTTSIVRKNVSGFIYFHIEIQYDAVYSIFKCILHSC